MHESFGGVKQGGGYTLPPFAHDKRATELFNKRKPVFNEMLGALCFASGDPLPPPHSPLPLFFNKVKKVKTKRGWGERGDLCE